MIPFSLNKWIKDHEHLLKPPVSNKVLCESEDYILMVVGGPNDRTDYHINETEEFFYQIKGDIVLKVIQDGKPIDISIKEGEVYLLPKKVPHGPQRPAGSIGLVIEHKRRPEHNDTFVWYCQNCHQRIFSKSFHVHNIETQLKELMNEYKSADKVCSNCGHLNEN